MSRQKEEAELIERLSLLIVQGPDSAFEQIAEKVLLRWAIEPEDAFGLLRLPEGAARMKKTKPYQQELKELRQLIAVYGTLLAGRKPAAGSEKQEAETALDAEAAAELEREMKTELAPLFERKQKLKTELAALKEPFRSLEARMEQALAQLRKTEAEEARQAGQSLNRLHERIRRQEEAIFAVDMEIAGYLQREGLRIRAAHAALELDRACRDLRDYGAALPGAARFVLCGWIRKKEIRKLQAALAGAQKGIAEAEQVQCRAAADEDCCVPLKTPVLVRGRWVLRRFRPIAVSADN